MNDLSSRRRKSGKELTPRHVLIGFLFLSVIGLVAILILFAGSVSIDSGDMTYADGTIKTTVNMNGNDPINVWVQHLVYKENGIFSREKIGDTHSVIKTLVPGQNVLECPKYLEPGTYKVFIYISTADDSQRRLAGITKTIDVS